MDISKTLFKLYNSCNCHRIYALDQIHKNKFANNFDDEEIRHVVKKMFNEDGDDLVDVTDEQIEAMLPFYQKTEEIALKEASRIFNKNFVYYKNTLEQKKFSFKDSFGNSLYTYLDGYSEDEKEIYVIEVKATTDRKFLELGPKEKKVLNGVFEKSNKQILKVKENLNEKQIDCLNKIYDKTYKCGCYFYDLAITNYIIKNSIKGNEKKINYYLGILNSNYVFDGNYINNEPSYYNGSENLFTFIDATKIIDGYQDIIQKEHQAIIVDINNNQINQSLFDQSCNNCIYKNICFSDLCKPLSIKTLLNPKRINDESIFKMYNQGIHFLDNIKEDNLTNPNHLIQYKTIKEIDYVNEKQIIEKLKEIKYPIYHLDFEAFSSPLPRFKGEISYMQSVFQFSIHIEKSPDDCDRKKDNYYYLPVDFSDHRKELIEEMIRIIDLRNDGTVLVYNKAFESSRIKELIHIFPQYKEGLTTILNHIYDLKDVVKGVGCDSVNYYHKDLEGSYSIKKVLPVFSDLSYKKLMIHNGCEAVVAYSKFKDLPKEDIEDLRKKLIEYCGLDTYSMVVILNGIRRRINYGK